jgi:transposase-like protein
VNTQDYACPNQQCPYFGITDAQIHRLLGDGKHGQAEQIQTFRGPACRTTFTSRRNTALSRLKTPSRQVAVVLTALAEGLDPSAAERVFGYRQATITSLSHSRWGTCPDVAQALFLQPPAPASPAG